MGNGILSQLGINAELMVVVLLVLWIISFIILIVLLVKYNTMKASYTMFMKGSDGESLEEQIGSLFNDIAVLKLSSEKNRNDIRKIIENLKDTYQRVGIVKYDAFKEVGGTLSFVLTLLTKENDGFIMNSMHSNKEGCYIYIKEVKAGEVFMNLSEEERQSLEQAMESSF